MADRKRTFLNPISDGAPAFVQAVADSSDNGTYKLGNYLLIIADCNRRVTLEFALTSKLARKRARAKVDRFTKVVNEFRKHVIKELESINNAERRIAASKGKTKVGKSTRKAARRS